jgi:hypothetical protein
MIQQFWNDDDVPLGPNISNECSAFILKCWGVRGKWLFLDPSTLEDDGIQLPTQWHITSQKTQILISLVPLTEGLQANLSYSFAEV